MPEALACSTTADVTHRVSHVGPLEPVHEEIDTTSQERECPLPMGSLSPWMRKRYQEVLMATLLEGRVADLARLAVKHARPNGFQRLKAHNMS